VRSESRENYLYVTSVKAGIRDRADGYIVTDLSFPTFVYEKYTAKPDDLEEGLFKSKILLQVRDNLAVARC
jgi:hypothetical protein